MGEEATARRAQTGASARPLAPPIARNDNALAPLYGAAHALLAREGRWRSILAGHIAPRPHDLVVELGCGGGELAHLLARMQPQARILGIDADPMLIERAKARFADVGDRLRFECAPTDQAHHVAPAVATKMVVTLTDTHSPDLKMRRLALAHAMLDARGALFVIDYGVQRTSLMRNLHNAARAFREAPPAPTHDALAPLIRNAGFVAVDEAVSWPTPSGAVSLYRARPN